MRYRLAQPLRVKEGDYVGLTAVTWMPAFAVNLDAAGNEWLASRPKRRCATPSSSRPERFEEYYRRTDAQLESSTAQEYRCTYQTARLLYWARIVPDAPAGSRPSRPLPSRRPGSPGRTARSARRGCRSAAACRSAVSCGGAAPPPLRCRRAAGVRGRRAAGWSGGGLLRGRCGRCGARAEVREEPGGGASSGTDCGSLLPPPPSSPPATTTPTITAGDDGGDAPARPGGAWGSATPLEGGRRLRQYGQSLRSRPTS